MRKPISTQTQAILDYTTVGFALAFPRVLKSSPVVRNVVTAIAITKLAYALITRQELSVAKVVPMKAHLAMDAVGGATLCALPFVAGEKDRRTILACVGMGLFDILVAPFVQTRASFEKTPPPPQGNRHGEARHVSREELVEIRGE